MDKFMEEEENELSIFDTIKEDDKIILFLNDDDVKQISELYKQAELFEHYKALTLSTYDKFQEMLVNIWNKIVDKHERCETAIYRGKTLGICKYNGRVVVVERDQ